MLYFVKKEELIAELQSRRSQGQSIGLVPTMGALHDGHMSLIQQARECDVVVVSLFVNPLQFNNNSDLEKYPSNLEKDVELLRDHCDVLYAPETDDMYDADPVLRLDFGPIENSLEGAFRPGHFSGVGIVVSKLFNIIQPHKAYFGQKDLQQLLIVKTMVRDLSIPVEIVGCPIIREENGLALSSRNQHLSPEGKEIAANIYGGLAQSRELFDKGTCLKEIKSFIAQLYAKNDGIDMEYAEIVNDQFEIMKSDPGNGSLSLCVAAYVEGVRLIDNLYLRSQE